ncbi:family 43 glycosylhydrolase [Streptomyces sp. NPDC046942]|uniref:family 43 glycosylhydrolase n=1 Tax=Streptomyces sp. NPDC046942 TaxID=3155137 RepID=UPI0033CF6959
MTAAGPAQAAPQTITNGTQFTDTSGSAVHAHGGGVIKVGSYYYWFGEDRNSDNTFRYVDAYRSTDLKNWEFRAHVLSQSSAAELSTAYIERPKVIYNAATGTFVMWMHKENGVDYTQARAAVAVSDTVDGSYSYQGSFQPLGQYQSRDMTTFVDTDGTAYLVSSANNNYDLNIYKLTADYTGIAGLVANPWPGGHREAPALFKRGGVYFMLTSAATGWSPNQQQYATATSPAGPWTSWKNVGDSTAYGSQTAYVLAVQGSSGTSFAAISQYTCNGGTNQKWWFKDLGNGYYELMGRGSSLCLQENASNVTQEDCTAATAQQWSVAASGSYVNIEARTTGECLDVSGASTADSAAVITYTCNGGTNQQWTRGT